jgi:hypothetical protein
LENIPHALDVHAQRVLKYNFILIYDSISSQKNYIRYMAVQYLKELMFIYKGTSMKRLMKKSDVSAVELRL